jgi:hypothetical protein
VRVAEVLCLGNGDVDVATVLNVAAKFDETFVEPGIS